MVPFDNVITKDSELYRLYNTNMYEKMERDVYKRQENLLSTKRIKRENHNSDISEIMSVKAEV